VGKFIGPAMLGMAAVLCLLAVAPPAVQAGDQPGAAGGRGPAGGRELASVLGVGRPARHGQAHVLRIERQAPAGGGAAGGPESPVRASGEFLQSMAAELPPTVQAAADRACEAARQGLKIAAGDFDRLGSWLARVVSQNSSLPVVTPAGNSYIPVSARHLFLGRDGRLKVVAPQ